MNNLLIKFWKGEIALWLNFWIFGVIISISLVIIGEYFFDKNTLEGFIWLGLSALYWMMVSISVWKSAKFTSVNISLTNFFLTKLIWRLLARVCAALFFLYSLLILSIGSIFSILEILQRFF